jgi:signal transduction histidine kinase
MSRKEDVDRLAMLTRVAAGLSHDFVNVMMFVLTTAEMIALDDTVSEESRERAQVIESAARHAARLADKLGMLARGVEPDRRIIDLVAFINHSGELLDQIAGSGIRVTLATPRVACPVLADPIELEQILLNLVFNAHDAMRGVGELAITLAYDGRDHVVLGVRDSGCGMPADVIARAFEPSFSTKPNGTGMGLAVVRRLVDEAHARISIESSPQGGTMVQIVWPIAELGGAANCG